MNEKVNKNGKVKESLLSPITRLKERKVSLRSWIKTPIMINLI
jgi:hypothetical protein